MAFPSPTLVSSGSSLGEAYSLILSFLVFNLENLIDGLATVTSFRCCDLYAS